MPSRDKGKSSAAKASGSGGHQYTFSKKVGMSTEKAKAKLIADKDKPLSNLKRKAASNFVQKLYRDDDELNELKVLAGEDNFDSDIEEKDDSAAKNRKRDSKMASKQQLGAQGSKLSLTTKVGKLVSIARACDSVIHSYDKGVFLIFGFYFTET